MGPVTGCFICWPILTVEEKRSTRHEIPKSPVKVSLCGGNHTYVYADENAAQCFHPPLEREILYLPHPNHVKLPFTLLQSA